MKIGLFTAIALTVGCRDVSKDIEALADRACACTDKVCAEKVVDDLVTFAKTHKNAKGDEDRAAKAAAKMMKCAVAAGADAVVLAAKMKGVSD